MHPELLGGLCDKRSYKYTDLTSRQKHIRLDVRTVLLRYQVAVREGGGYESDALFINNRRILNQVLMDMT